VHYYRKAKFTIVWAATTNGLERVNEDFKNQYLFQKSNKSLSRMLAVLVDDFSPAKYQR